MDMVTDALTGVVIDALVGVMIGVGVSMFVDVEIVVATVSIVLKFVVPVLNCMNVLSEVAVDGFMEALSGVWADLTIGGVPGIGVDILVVVNVNILAAVVTPPLRGATSAPVEAFSCWAACSR